MRRGTRLGVLVGLPVLLVAIGAVLAALVWLQQRNEGSIQQALSDARQQPGAARAAEGSTGATSAAASQSSAAQAATGGRQAVPVRRGPITDQLTLDGRIAASDEVLLGFGITGKVASVAVKPGDAVQEGQLLIEADAEQLNRDLVAARNRVEVGVLRQEQAQQQAQARQRDTERRGASDQARKDQTVREAESALKRAQADYERVKAGATDAERRTAQTAVDSAQVSYDSAVAAYNQAYAGPTDLDARAADQSVQTAQLQLQKAQADLQKLGSGPDPADVRAAERDLFSAQNTYAQSVAAVEKVSQPDPVAVSTAQREVQRAQNALRAAQNMKSNDGSSKTQKQIAVQNAAVDLQSAQDRLNQLQQGPPPMDVETARRNMLAARSTIDAARDKLELVKRGPDQLTLQQAQQAVDSAQLGVDQAAAKQAQLGAGPTQDQVNRLAVGIRQAQAALDTAKQQLADVNAKPAKQDLQDAQDRLTAAQGNLQRAQDDAQADPSPDTDTSAYDIQVLEKGLAQDRSQVESLERQVAQTRLRAPFAGTVSSVRVRAGDTIEAERAVLTLAKPGDPVLRADVTDRDAQRLAQGQRAAVRLGGPDGGEFDASIDLLMDGENGVGKTVQLSALWPDPTPAIGTPVQIVVTLNEKPDVLLVPQKAIRTAGARRFVEVIDGQNRTMTDVEVGIISNGQAEIVSGLKQDQLVLVNP
jgi:RND family efflux transporter MFP subunit